jgi:hypothetical protein
MTEVNEPVLLAVANFFRVRFGLPYVTQRSMDIPEFAPRSWLEITYIMPESDKAAPSTVVN